MKGAVTPEVIAGVVVTHAAICVTVLSCVYACVLCVLSACDVLHTYNG